MKQEGQRRSNRSINKQSSHQHSHSHDTDDENSYKVTRNTQSGLNSMLLIVAVFVVIIFYTIWSSIRTYSQQLLWVKVSYLLYRNNADPLACCYS